MDTNATVYSDTLVNFTNNSSSNHLKIHKHKLHDSLGICSHAIRNDWQSSGSDSFTYI